LSYAIVGSPATAQAKLDRFLEATRADELIVSTPIHDFAARLKSIEYFAKLRSFKRLAA
jgi:alkanesulfonate monooxygenase SsuD/methylene tetrahydromethanopterin reductase-like flavin-dependent oxidoreductase (luciferase family)